MKLETGNNLIDIAAMLKQTISIKIDTPFESILKELKLEENEENFSSRF